MDNIHKCIYMLISPTLECYIGQTKNVKRRFREHRRAKGGCRRLYNAINFYGWDNFLKVIIEVFDDDVSGEFIDEREIYWIKEHNTLSPNGYNLEEGGNGPRKLSEETRELMSKAKIGNNWNVGKPRSAETKSKMSQSVKRFYENLSDEEKRKRSRKHTLEDREKMSRGVRDYYENRTEEQIAQHKERSYQNVKKYMKPVIATEKKTGIKRKFESTYDAARTLAIETGKKFNRGHVGNCANKRPNYKSHHGWTFEFVISKNM